MKLFITEDESGVQNAHLAEGKPEAEHHVERFNSRYQPTSYYTVSDEGKEDFSPIHIAHEIHICDPFVIGKYQGMTANDVFDILHMCSERSPSKQLFPMLQDSFMHVFTYGEAVASGNVPNAGPQSLARLYIVDNRKDMQDALVAVDPKETQSAIHSMNETLLSKGLFPMSVSHEINLSDVSATDHDYEVRVAKMYTSLMDLDESTGNDIMAGVEAAFVRTFQYAAGEKSIL